MEASLELSGEQREKMDEQIQSASAFHAFRASLNRGLPRLLEQEGQILELENWSPELPEESVRKGRKNKKSARRRK